MRLCLPRSLVGYAGKVKHSCAYDRDFFLKAYGARRLNEYYRTSDCYQQKDRDESESSRPTNVPAKSSW